MIIACTACPAQYSIPDAKIRGKKVRITCKHCAAAIIVDATRLGSDAPTSGGPAAAGATPGATSAQKPRPPRPEVAAAAAVAAPPPFSDGALGAPFKFGDRGPDSGSIHEEPTVIGRIPREALEYERLYAKRTAPPPAVPPANEPAPEALPAEPPANEAAPEALPAEPTANEATPEVAAVAPASLSTTPTARPSPSQPEAPESPIDETKRASPQAFRSSTTPEVPKATAPKPGPDAPTLGSRRPGEPSSAEKVEAPRRSRTLLVIGLLIVVLILAFVSQRLR